MCPAVKLIKDRGGECANILMLRGNNCFGDDVFKHYRNLCYRRLFLMEGWGCVNLMIFIQFESFYVLVRHRESIIPGNFGFAKTKY